MFDTLVFSSVISPFGLISSVGAWRKFRSKVSPLGQRGLSGLRARKALALFQRVDMGEASCSGAFRSFSPGREKPSRETQVVRGAPRNTGVVLTVVRGCLLEIKSEGFEGKR